MADFVLEPRFALTDIAKAGRYGAQSDAPVGLTIQEQRGVRILHVSARSGHGEAVCERLSNIVGQRVSDGPKATQAPPTPQALDSQNNFGQIIIGVGRGQWLCLTPGTDVPSATESNVDIGELATLTDHTSAKVILSLHGPHVRDALAKGCQLDLHPSIFGPGMAATTQIDQIVCQLWRLDDSDTFQVMMARSFSLSFWSWLTHASAEFGYQVLAPRVT
ncbi:MAG: sarcosine oxidase subunit gamma family protein [Pseudomonadota bacterium]